MTRTINHLSSTVPVAIDIRKEVEKHFWNKPNCIPTETLRIRPLWGTRQEWKTRFCHRRWTRHDHRVLRKTYLTMKRRIQSRTVPFLLRRSRILAVMISVATRKGAGAIKIAVFAAPKNSRHSSGSIPSPALKFWFRGTKGIRLPFTIMCIVIFTSQKAIDDIIVLQLQKMRKNVAVQMKTRIFNGQDSFFVITFLTEFRQACDSLQIPESPAVELCSGFMSSTVLIAIKARLTPSPNHANRHENATTTYTAVVNHLLRRSASEDVADNGDKNIRKFKPSSLTP